MIATHFPRPAVAMHDHAIGVMRLRSSRAEVNEWLTTLGLADDDKLLQALAGRDRASTRLLLESYRGGSQLAATVLVGAKVAMLASLARNAAGETSDERFQATFTAFLHRALPRVHPDHKFADEQLYWITLRTIAQSRDESRDELRTAPYGVEFQFTAGADVVADLEHYTTAGAILDWAQQEAIISAEEHHVLRLRFGGSEMLSVRELADQLDVHQRQLESQVRRAMGRLKSAVASDPDAVMQACLSQGQSTFAAPAHGEVGVGGAA